MNTQNRVTRTILSTTLVLGALFTGAHAEASEPDTVLMASLEALADAFGDGARIENVDDNGETTVLAIELEGDVGVYTSGDRVSADAELVFCYEDPRAGLSACEGVPNVGAYECDSDENESWCDCFGLLDCIDLLETGPCTSGLDCGKYACTCSA